MPMPPCFFWLFQAMLDENYFWRKLLATQAASSDSVGLFVFHSGANQETAERWKAGYSFKEKSYEVDRMKKVWFQFQFQFQSFQLGMLEPSFGCKRKQTLFEGQIGLTLNIWDKFASQRFCVLFWDVCFSLFFERFGTDVTGRSSGCRRLLVFGAEAAGGRRRGAFFFFCVFLWFWLLWSLLVVGCCLVWGGVFLHFEAHPSPRSIFGVTFQHEDEELRLQGTPAIDILLSW